MHRLHERPSEVSKLLGLAMRSLLSLSALCLLSPSYVLANGTEDKTPAAVKTTDNCAEATVANGGKGVFLNEPSRLAQMPWIELPSAPSIEQIINDPALNGDVNLMIPITTIPMTPENVIDMYLRGFKLYQNHSLRTGGVQEVHQFQFNRYRGVLTRENFARAMTNNLTVRGYRNDIDRRSQTVTEYIHPGKNTFKNLMEAMYPHRLPRQPNSDGLPKNHPGLIDRSRPAFELRINTDVAELLRLCGIAERRDIDPVTKEVRVDAEGHTLMTTSTWFTPPVQEVVKKLVDRGYAYTFGVYTTEHHPWVILQNQPEVRAKRIASGKGLELPGKLVGGIASIRVNNVATGLTLYLDRTLGSFKDGGRVEYVYGNAGKLAFFAEVFHTFETGVDFLDAVTVNEAAKLAGAVLIPREMYLEQYVKVAHQANLPYTPPAPGVYEIPWETFSHENLYRELGMEPPPAQNAKKNQPKDKG